MENQSAVPGLPTSQSAAPVARNQRTQSLNGEIVCVYERYWNQPSVQQGLLAQQVIQGPIRINPIKYHDAYVPHPDNKSDVYVCGFNDRNGALNGDKVFLMLYPKEQWIVKQSLLNELKGSTLSRLPHRVRTAETPERSLTSLSCTRH
jgi:DIS3-like exonuclease 2